MLKINEFDTWLEVSYFIIEDVINNQQVDQESYQKANLLGDELQEMILENNDDDLIRGIKQLIIKINIVVTFLQLEFYQKIGQKKNNL